jgi:hypothetical protein
MPAATPLPGSVQEFDAAWLDGVLGHVRSSEVVKVIHGTATKICVEVTFDATHDPPHDAARDATRDATRDPTHVPGVQRFWIKTGMEPHSRDKRMDQVYAGETFYYSQLAGKYETRTPRCYFSATDADGHSVIVLDDLEAIGARFVEPVAAGSPDFVARALEAIARYQAASWMAPELHAVEWLRMGGSHRAYDFISWLYAPDHWDVYSQRPRFQKLPPALRDRDLLVRAHRRLQDAFWPSEPWALAHGDCHFGQAYQLPDGEVRLLDWQAVQTAHWAHDVSYFMAGALAVADRRHFERDLLHHYLAKLAEFGVVQPPSEAQAWLAYRANVLHGIGWVMCPVEMQPEENCCVFAERFATAVTQLGSLELVLA